MREHPKFQSFFANHHKIPQNFKILTFDFKTALKIQNIKNSILHALNKRYCRTCFFAALLASLVVHQTRANTQYNTYKTYTSIILYVLLKLL
jgi:hypothetical protein